MFQNSSSAKDYSREIFHFFRIFQIFRFLESFSGDIYLETLITQLFDFPWTFLALL